MKKRKPKHDPNTCFGCRLYALIRELYPDGPQNDKDLYEIMMTLANCSADMLRCTDRGGVKHFLTTIMAKVIENEQDQPLIH